MKRVFRGLRAAFRAAALLLCCAVAPTGATAQQVMVVGNDRGGYVGVRASEVMRLKAARTQVRILGDICYSSCTMYLGAGDVCVSPSTTFGFHGPSRNGVPLPQSQFEHFSNLMAQHYSPGLRDWFMRSARYSIHAPYTMRGSELIRLGYRSCG